MPRYGRRICPGWMPLVAGVTGLLIATSMGRAAQPAAGFDGQRAFGYLTQLCKLGPRYSGSPGMAKQQQLIESHFDKLGLNIQRQVFRSTRDRFKGSALPMTNLIVALNPQATERIILCAHYDTRPFPDRDPDMTLRRKGSFLGANDGASGTAALMELAHSLQGVGGARGVDLVFFDGEEYVVADKGEYFLGSTYFARQLKKAPPKHRYVAAVLLDMIADKNLGIKYDGFSNRWSDSRPLVDELWNTAKNLGVFEFQRDQWPGQVQDDHLPLHNIAGLPACDVIDFNYPDTLNSYWHTTADVPENCSAESLQKVGKVVLAWAHLRLAPPAAGVVKP